jgi:hypothetical protein
MELTTTLPRFENDLADTLRLFDAGIRVQHESADEGLTWRDRFTVSMQARSLTRSFEQQGPFFRRAGIHSPAQAFLPAGAL